MEIKAGRVTVKHGRLSGKTVAIEGTMQAICRSDSLSDLARQGNFAAQNAIKHDGYDDDSGPFYYVKIGLFGFIISRKDLGI